MRPDRLSHSHRGCSWSHSKVYDGSAPPNDWPRSLFPRLVRPSCRPKNLVGEGAGPRAHASGTGGNGQAGRDSCLRLSARPRPQAATQEGQLSTVNVKISNNGSTPKLSPGSNSEPRESQRTVRPSSCCTTTLGNRWWL